MPSDEDVKLANFKEAMLPVVDDALRLANRSVLAEKAATAETWARVLYGKVPEFRLPDAFDRAFEKKISEAATSGQKPFPVDAYDLAVAWKEIEAEEKARIATREQEERESSRVVHCRNRANHDPEDLVAYPDPFDYPRDIWLPCSDCRFEAFQQALSRYKEKHFAAVSSTAAASDAVRLLADEQTGFQIEQNIELLRSDEAVGKFNAMPPVELIEDGNGVFAIAPPSSLICEKCGRKVLASSGAVGDICGYPIEFNEGGGATKLCPGTMIKDRARQNGRSRRPELRQ